MDTQHSGQLGIVLLLEPALNQKAQNLSSQIGSENMIHLGAEHIPHISLYHSKLGTVSPDKVNELLEQIASKLPITIHLTQVAPFGGKFLFWDLEKTTELIELHQIALSLSTYFETDGLQQADTEQIALTLEEDANVRKYGHPLVGDVWRPHVTLAYIPNSVTNEIRTETAEGHVVGVAFVRIGEMGIIEEVLSKKGNI